MALTRDSYRNGRLTTKLTPPRIHPEVKPGIQPLGLDAKKDGLLYVPKSYDPDTPAALALMLHGSGGNPEQGMWLLQRYADAHNLLLLAPASRQYSWDIIASQNFGPDVLLLDQALEMVFNRFAVDPARIALGGFSDGASYALGLGLTNGDLFTHIIAFSPGFAYTIEQQGKPAIFISHGVHDGVLPIEKCGRVVQRDLKSKGLEVVYQEFEGEHEIPANISARAVEWFMAPA